MNNCKELYKHKNKVLYFDSFEDGHIPREIQKFIGGNSQLLDSIVFSKNLLMTELWLSFMSVY